MYQLLGAHSTHCLLIDMSGNHSWPVCHKIPSPVKAAEAYTFNEHVPVNANHIGNVWLGCRRNTSLYSEICYFINGGMTKGIWYIATIISFKMACTPRRKPFPDSTVYGANMGPTWGWQDPGGTHVGPMDLALWACGLKNIVTREGAT